MRFFCRTLEYDEDRIESGGSEFDVLIAPKEPKQIDHASSTEVASLGFQSSKKSNTKTSKASSFSSKARAKAAARKSDLAKLRVQQLKENLF